MSIEAPGSNNSNKPAGAPLGDAFARAGASVGANANQSSGNARTSRGGRGSGILDINHRMRRPVSRNTTGEAVQGFVKALNKQLEIALGTANQTQFAVHVLDNNSAAVALSAILLCYSENHNNQNQLAVFTCVIEASSGRLASRIINIGGQNVENTTVAGDVVDKTLWDKITQFLTDTYGAKMEIHNAGAMVLPTELNPEDEQHMHRVAFQATAAVYTVMNDVTGGEEPLTVGMIDNGVTLTAAIDYNPGDTDNAVSLPVRNDVSITLRGQMSQQQQGGVPSPHEQIRDLTVVTSYIDLVYTEPKQPAYGQAPDGRRFTPRIVITGMDSQIDAVTPELQLLALSTAMLASRNMAWGGAFANRGYNNGANLRDIGGIGYELNLSANPQEKPDRINTDADTFSNQALFQLLQMSCHDSLIYSMDVEETGEQSWIHQMFIAAAAGQQTAYDAVYKSADRLSEGHFARLFEYGSPIANDDNVRVHLGYYEDQSGQRRDDRNIDTLALYNLLGATDMPTVINWGRTFDDASVPQEMRLEQREKILKGLLGNVRIKGYARRITFHPKFMIALATAIHNAGLVIRPQNLMTNFHAQQGRGNYNAAAFGVGAAAGDTLFNYSQQPYGGYQGSRGPFTGRFG